MRGFVLLVVVLSLVPVSSAAGVQRDTYEIGAAYMTESDTPECEDAHVACFGLTGAETSLIVGIVDDVQSLLPRPLPVAAQIWATGPTGFTTGILCGEGEIRLASPRTHLRVEILLAGAGDCDWSAEAGPQVAAVPRAGEVLLKTRSAAAAADAVITAGTECSFVGPTLVCAFAGADGHRTGAALDAFVGEEAVGVGAYQVEGFFGRTTIAHVHGERGELGWHASLGATDYTHDDVPESTCACAGVWSERTGYIARLDVGAFDNSGDGPTPDDAYVVFGGAGVLP